RADLGLAVGKPARLDIADDEPRVAINIDARAANARRERQRNRFLLRRKPADVERVGIGVDHDRRAGKLRRPRIADVTALALLDIIAAIARRRQRPHQVVDALQVLRAGSLRLECVVGVDRRRGKNNGEEQLPFHDSFWVRYAWSRSSASVGSLTTIGTR